MNPTEGGTRVASESSALKMRCKSQLLTGCILQRLKYRHTNNPLIIRHINVCLSLYFPSGNDVYGVRKINLAKVVQVRAFEYRALVSYPNGKGYQFSA